MGFGAKIGGHRQGAVDRSDVSRVVISFNNNGGGHLFAHWIRTELMKALNYFSQNSVYLDNVAARYNCFSGGTVHSTGLSGPLSQNPVYNDAMARGVPLVAPHSFGAPNYKFVGGMHVDWEDMWADALKTSKVLIQLQTEEYLKASKTDGSPCARELGRINKALDGGEISVLALRFGDIPERAIDLHRGPRTTSMLVSKVALGFSRPEAASGFGSRNKTMGRKEPGGIGAIAGAVGKALAFAKGGSIGQAEGVAFEGAWKLSPTDLDRVIRFCRENGC